MLNDINLNYFYDNVNYTQRQKVWGTKVPRYNEIWWFWPKGDATECTDVLIYNVTPTITQIGPFCESDPCVTLNGTPIGGVFSGLGVNGTQFCPDPVTNGTNNTSTITYTITSGGCTFSTQSTVGVYGTPSLSPIQHN
jgi:hypothetical protein